MKINGNKPAEAAYDIIKQKTDLGLDLVPYPQIFNDVNNQKAEVILYRPTGESGDFEKANFPIGVEGGKTSTCPTQNLMEAYDMKVVLLLYGIISQIHTIIVILV